MPGCGWGRDSRPGLGGTHMGDRRSDRKGTGFRWDSAVSHESSRLMVRSHARTGGLRTWERVSSLCRRLKNGVIPAKTGGRLGKSPLSHVQYLFWPDRHAPSVPTPPPYVLQSSWAHGLNRWLRPFGCSSARRSVQLTSTSRCRPKSRNAVYLSCLSPRQQSSAGSSLSQ